MNKADKILIDYMSAIKKCTYPQSVIGCCDHYVAKTTRLTEDDFGYCKVNWHFHELYIIRNNRLMEVVK